MSCHLSFIFIKDEVVFFTLRQLHRIRMVEKELLEFILSKWLSSQTGPSRAMCWGPCPDSFLVSDSKDGDSTASLDSLWQDIIVLTVKKSVLIFKVILLCFSVCPLPLVLQPEVVQFHLLYTFPSHNHKIPLLPLISSPGWSFCYWKDDPVP